MGSNMLLKVHNKDGQEKIHQLVSGKPLLLEAEQNTVFQLLDEDTLLAPQNIRVEKVGDDLSIFLDADSDIPSIVIEKYYLYGDEPRLVGQQSVGELKAYNTSAVNYMGDGANIQIALDQNIATAPSFDTSDDMLMGWIVAGLYLSILAVGLSRIDQDDETQTNRLEEASDVTVSADGLKVTGQAKTGTKVVVSVAGKEVIVEVDREGKFTATLDEALTNGEEIKVVVQDNAGNSSKEIIVHAPIVTPPDVPPQDIPTDAVVITVDKVAGDDIVDTAEAKEGIKLTGKYSIKEDFVTNDSIKVVINIDGKDYEAIVDKINKSWSLAIENNATNQAIYGNGQHNFTVKITADGKEGNKVVDNTASGSFAVNIVVVPDTPLTLTVDTVEGDNIVDAVEAQDGIQVSGKYTVDPLMDLGSVQLIVTISGQSFNAELANGHWSLTIENTDTNKALFIAGAYQYQVVLSAKDGLGTEHKETKTADVTVTVPKIADNVEISADGQTITGQAEVGTKVNVVTPNGDKEVTVDTDGKFNVTLDEALTQGEEIKVIVQDKVGNSSETVIVNAPNITPPPQDIPADAVVVTVDKVAGDDVVDADEAKDGIKITGQYSIKEEFVVNDSVKVVINIDGKDFNAVVDKANKSWSLSIENNAANQAIYNNGQHDFTAKITADAKDSDKVADNTASSSFTVDIVVVPENPLTLTVDAVAGDNIVDTVEAQDGIKVTGIYTVDSLMDQSSIQLILTISGQSFNAELANGRWSLTIENTDTNKALFIAGAYQYQVVLSAKDGLGAEHKETKTADVTVTVPKIADNVEISADGQTITGQAEVGTKVNVTTPNGDKEVTVDTDGKFTATLDEALTNGEEIKVVVQDNAGNSSTAVTVNAPIITPPPQDIPADAVVVTVDKVAGDDVVDTDEAKDGIKITGQYSIKEEFVVNDSVKMVINIDGKDYEAVVDKANKSWSLAIENNAANQAIYNNGKHDFTAKITADAKDSDKVADNTASSSFTVDIVVVPENPLSLTVDTIEGDNIVDTVEAQDGIKVTGTYTVDPLMEQSSIQLILSVANQTFNPVFTDGSWNLTIENNDVNKTLFTAGAYDYQLSISAEDLTGQVHTETVSKMVTVAVPKEAEQLEVSADGQTVTGLAQVGTQVVVSVAGKETTVDVDDKGKFTATLDEALTQGEEIKVIVQDKVGNSSDAVAVNAPNITPPPQDTPDDAIKVIVDKVAGDNIVDTQEALQSPKGVEIKGTYIIDKELLLNDTVEIWVTVDNHKGRIAPNYEDQSWSYFIYRQPSNRALYDNGEHQLTVEVSAEAKDGSGKVTDSVSSSYTVNIIYPEDPYTLTINPIAGDNIVDTEELIDGSLKITGTYSVDPNMDQSVSISLGVSNESYNNAYIAKLNKDEGTWSVIVGHKYGFKAGIYKYNFSIYGRDGSGEQHDKQIPISVEILAPKEAQNIEVSADGQTVTGLAQMGTKVVVTVADKEVIADVDENRKFAVTLDEALTNGEEIQVIVQDKVGNSSGATTINAPTTVPPQDIPDDALVVTVDKVAGDDIVDTVEAKEGIKLTGQYGIKEEFVLADTVKVKINLDGQDFDAVIDKANHSWSVVIDNNVANQEIYSNGQHDFAVEITADAKEENKVVDNTISGSFAVNIVVVPDNPLTLTVDTVEGDNIVDAVEAQDGIQISGAYTIEEQFLDVNSVKVMVTVAEKEFNATLDTANQTWAMTIDNNDDNQAIYVNGSHDVVVKIIATTLVSDEIITKDIVSKFDVDIEQTPSNPTNFVEIKEIVDNVGLVRGVIEKQGKFDDTTPLLKGVLTNALQAGETVELYRNGIKVGEANVDGQEWRYEDAYLEVNQSHTYVAKIIGVNKNIINQSEQYEVTHQFQGKTNTKVKLSFEEGEYTEIDGVKFFNTASAHTPTASDSPKKLMLSVTNFSESSGERILLSYNGGTTWHDLNITENTEQEFNYSGRLKGKYNAKIRIVDKDNTVAYQSEGLEFVLNNAYPGTGTMDYHHGSRDHQEIQFLSISDDKGLDGDFVTERSNVSINLVAKELHEGDKVLISLSSKTGYLLGYDKDIVYAQDNKDGTWSIKLEDLLKASGKDLDSVDNHISLYAHIINQDNHISRPVIQELWLADSTDVIQLDSQIKVYEDTSSSTLMPYEGNSYQANDGITKCNTLKFSGIINGAKSSTNVDISLDDGVNWHKAQVDGNLWYYDDSDRKLADGKYSIKVRAQDDGVAIKDDQGNELIYSKDVIVHTVAPISVGSAISVGIQHSEYQIVFMDSSYLGSGLEVRSNVEMKVTDIDGNSLTPWIYVFSSQYPEPLTPEFFTQRDFPNIVYYHFRAADIAGNVVESGSTDNDLYVIKQYHSPFLPKNEIKVVDVLTHVDEQQNNNFIISGTAKFFNNHGDKLQISLNMGKTWETIDDYHHGDGNGNDYASTNWYYQLDNGQLTAGDHPLLFRLWKNGDISSELPIGVNGQPYSSDYQQVIMHVEESENQINNVNLKFEQVFNNYSVHSISSTNDGNFDFTDEPASNKFEALLINPDDNLGGNGHSRVNNFQLGRDKIDLSTLLEGQSIENNLNDYLSVKDESGSSIISIDRDGAGKQFSSADIVTLSEVSTTLEQLLSTASLIY